MSSALCCSDLTWPSLLSRASASSSRLVGTRRTNDAVEWPSPVATCEDCTKPPAAWVARTTPSVGLLHVGRAQLQARAALDAALAGGGGRGRRRQRPSCRCSLLAASEDRVWAGAAPTALPPPPLLALSFVPPPELSATATMAATTQPATPRAGISGRRAKRRRGSGALEAALDALIQARPERLAPSPASRRARRARARRARARRRDRRRGRPRAPRARRPRRDRGWAHDGA